jgi:hypothetical protein
LKKIYIIIGLAFLCKLAFPQQDLTLYYMDRIPQVTSTNPAFFPESKINVGIPLISSIYFSASNSGFSSKTLEDINLGINNLDERNYLSVNNKINLIDFGFRVNKNYFSLNITEHFMGRLTYPKDLLLFAWEGNGESLVGKRANMDGLAFDFMHYREYGLGYSRKLLDDKLSVGVKVKYLSGFQNLFTKRSQLGLYTDDENYGFILDGALELNSSGLDNIANGDYNPMDMAINAGNHGMGVDLGVNYQYSKELSFSAAVLDLGYINWTHNVRNFKNNDFRFSFTGLDIVTMYTSNDTLPSYLEALSDSLQELFQLTENGESYQTMLNARFMVGGLYAFHKKHSVGALVHGDVVKGYLRPAVTVSLNTKVQRWLSTTLAYSYYNKNFMNVGFGLSLNAGPVQYYIISDNILAAFMPYSVRNAHVRFGFNLTFGRPAKE